jgi:hypothetical protein
MRVRFLKKLLCNSIIFLLLYYCNNVYYAKEKDKSSSGKSNTLSVTARYSKFNINNISTYIYNNGLADCQPNNNSSFVYPKGTDRTAIFCSGVCWGGKVDGQIRTGGSTYWSGLNPGRILNDGIAEDPNSENARVYRVRRDYKTASLDMEAADENKSKQEIYARYEKDWNEWPAINGAPFEDVDGNGIYDPTIDNPGVPGADQTLWFTANDLDSLQTKNLYGALPFGIEMQVTVWGYNLNQPPFGNAIFKRYLIINKSKKDFKEMYVGVWSDPDLGDAGDDLVGCDTTMNLGYVYNGRSVDYNYTPLGPPSIGFCLLQGPLVNGNAGDKGYYKNHLIQGKKNLPMTAFSNIYKNGGGIWHEPRLKSYQDGTLFLYNLFQGFMGDGTPHPLPISMGTGSTKFPYSGDPVNGTGFIGINAVFPGGNYSTPADKKMMVCSGPFNMAPGDTQEVVFAEIAGGAEKGVDYLNAITLMKSYAANIRYFSHAKSVPVISQTIPATSVTGLDKQIVLDWGSNINQINSIENGNYINNFEGYNVYQFPYINSKLSDGKLIATFDIVDGVGKIFDMVYDSVSQILVPRAVRFGSDSGIQRFLSLTKDYIRNEPLCNGSDYFFGVTHYSYNAAQYFPVTYESGFNTIKIKPQTPPPGARYGNKYGDIIQPSQHAAGNSAAVVTAFVVDPSKLVSADYEVTFQIAGSSKSFSVTNMQTGLKLLSGQTNLLGDNNYVVTDGFILRVNDSASNPLTEKDIYRFKIAGVVQNQNLAKEDVENINVFPNPYYGYNRNETNKYERIVTFTHLPQRATIKIFNLAGQLVRTLEKNSSDQFLRWDLLNESRFFAASGVYIAYIEMPDLGKTKILKLAIIQEQIVQDWF